eukprot:scaffold1166_cov261-Pinguiococcus_pyrenoidosus.AAC.30
MSPDLRLTCSYLTAGGSVGCVNVTGKVRSVYGYARPRMDEALNAEVLYLLNNPSSPPVAQVAIVAEILQEAGEAPPPLPTVRAMPTGGCLIMYSPQFARFVSPEAQMPEPNDNLHFALCLLLKMPVVDRTGVIVDPTVRVRVLSPIPKGPFDNSPLSMDVQYTTHGNVTLQVALPKEALHKSSLWPRAVTICRETSLFDLIEQRAAKIFDMASALPSAERRIDLLWSGGIDSTTALAAFLHFPETSFRQRGVRVRLFYNASSIAEFPVLGNWLRGNCGPGRRVPHFELYRIPDDSPIADNIDLTSGITVTGEYGDQLQHAVLTARPPTKQIFGSILMAGAFKKEPSFIFKGTKANRRRLIGSELQDPWREGVRERLQEMNILREDRIDALMALLVKQASQCPFDIRTKFDWLWWINFSMKYQYVGLRLLNRVQDLSRAKADRLVHFFGGDEFQLWALSERNHQFKFPRKATNRAPHGFRTFPMYKILLKAYIAFKCEYVSVRGRTNYFNNKVGRHAVLPFSKGEGGEGRTNWFCLKQLVATGEGWVAEAYSQLQLRHGRRVQRLLLRGLQHLKICHAGNLWRLPPKGVACLIRSICTTQVSVQRPAGRGSSGAAPSGHRGGRASKIRPRPIPWGRGKEEGEAPRPGTSVHLWLISYHGSVNVERHWGRVVQGMAGGGLVRTHSTERERARRARRRRICPAVWRRSSSVYRERTEA